MDSADLLNTDIFGQIGSFFVSVLSGNVAILLVMIGLPVGIFGVYFYKKYHTYIWSLAKCLLSVRYKKEKEPLLTKIKRRKVPLEIYSLIGDKFVYTCKGRLIRFDEETAVIRIVQYEREVEFRKNNVIMAYITPVKFRGEEVNCFRTVIRRVSPRELELRRLLVFDFYPRRAYIRRKVKHQANVRLQLWFAAATQGPNTFLMLPPHMEVNVNGDVDQNKAEPEPPLILNMSEDGVGVLITYEMRNADFSPNEPITANVMLFDDEVQDFQHFWVAGALRSIEEHKSQALYVGIQFQKIAADYSEDLHQLNWKSIADPRASDAFRKLVSRL